MKQWTRLFLVLVIGLPVALAAVAPPELATLVRAREVLGAESWSAVVQLERAGSVRVADTGLVFEFADALWLYRPVDGTQSLSRHWNDVAAERRQLLTLLQRIDPEYVAYRQLSEPELPTHACGGKRLPNGCFIESAGEARRLTREAKVGQQCLLLYYVKTADGLRGHTVLCYENASGAHVYDPAEGRAQKVRSASVCDQAMDLARRIAPPALVRGLAKAAKIALR